MSQSVALKWAVENEYNFDNSLNGLVLWQMLAMLLKLHEPALSSAQIHDHGVCEIIKFDK